MGPENGTKLRPERGPRIRRRVEVAITPEREVKTRDLQRRFGIDKGESRANKTVQNLEQKKNQE